MLRRLVLAASTLLALLLMLEVLFRVLPVSTSTETGYHIGPDILVYPPSHEWRVSTGWDLRNAHTLRANNLGFAAARDFVPDPKAVALIGDSFIEASMLHADERPAAHLERALGGRPVYAMGGPGSSLLDYADRVQLARSRLQVNDIVIMLEAGDVRQAMCGSGNVHSACLGREGLEPRRERVPVADTLKRVLRRSALAQYLFSQLKPGAGLRIAQACPRARDVGRHRRTRQATDRGSRRRVLCACGAGPPARPHGPYRRWQSGPCQQAARSGHGR